MIPDWLMPTVILIPAAAWMFGGVGAIWAWAALPRDVRRSPAVFAATAIALGGALSTAGMFFLGTFGTLTPGSILLVTGLAALIGLLSGRIAPRGDRGDKGGSLPPTTPWNALDLALAGVIAVAILLRFWNTAYWPFTTYDALWVYGYNARVFGLEGAIPRTMGYYPQLVPLAYTYMQSAWSALGGGLIDDHAARVVIPYFAAGGILMAYTLGGLAFRSRRAGLLTAALWALYPHHGVWSQFGDLEVTVTFYFTGTAAFFVAGWRDKRPRLIALSGLLMGAALWTKPTAAALAQSLFLIGAGSVIQAAYRHRGALQERIALALRTAFGGRYAFLALVCAAPLGGMWYVRNVLYGHPPLVFPPGYWQAEAQRSGQELGFPLLIAALLVFWLTIRAPRWRDGANRLAAGWAGLGLLLLGILPSAYNGQMNWATLSQGALGQIVAGLMPTRLGPLEFGIIALGIALILYALWPVWRKLGLSQRQTLLGLIAFIAPYFVTWFFAYSYHYRLSFPLVPSMLALAAYPLSRLLDGLRLNNALRRFAVVAIIVTVALPGWWSVLSALPWALAAPERLPDDHAKLAQGNPALVGLVDFLSAERARLGRPLRVIAPGELRLNFFFPQDDIRGDLYPTTLDTLTGVDYFVDSSVGQRLYIIQGTFFNQILASLTREPYVQRVYTVDDSNFRFSVYTIDNAARFEAFEGRTNAQVGDFAVLLQTDLSTLNQYPDENLYITNWWRALGPAKLDYSVFIHLWDAQHARLIAAWGGQPVEGAFNVWQDKPGAHIAVPYPTRLWQAGELVKDEWKVRIPKDAPPGVYELRVGLFEPVGNTRLPVRLPDGSQGEWVLIHHFTVLDPKGGG